MRKFRLRPGNYALLLVVIVSGKNYFKDPYYSSLLPLAHGLHHMISVFISVNKCVGLLLYRFIPPGLEGSVYSLVLVGLIIKMAY